jgi:hypothetical protein
MAHKHTTWTSDMIGDSLHRVCSCGATRLVTAPGVEPSHWTAPGTHARPAPAPAASAVVVATIAPTRPVVVTARQTATRDLEDCVGEMGSGYQDTYGGDI